MIKIGEYNVLKVIKEKPMGFFLDDGDNGILLPKRFVPAGTKTGDELEVFLYHDGEDRLIATTQKPYGKLGDIVMLQAVNVTPQGAFLDWGLMKDLFIPRSKIRSSMVPGGRYLVKIVQDARTGRLAATEKIEAYLSNKELTVEEKQLVDLLVYRQTQIGYEVIINHQHKGILHRNEVFRSIAIGDTFRGFIKKIIPGSGEDFLIDVVAGKPGYERVGDETEKIMDLLRAHKGFLPYHDKSSPEEIYNFFGISKKAFKMATGHLYKKKKIFFTPSGIRLQEE